MDMDIDDPEIRLLTIGTIGWFLAGLLTVVLIKIKRNDRKLGKNKDEKGGKTDVD